MKLAVLVEAVLGSTVDEGLAPPPKTIGVAAGTGVGLGTGTGIGICAGGGAGLGTGAIVDVDVDASGAGAKGADATGDVDDDVDISTVALSVDSGVREAPLVGAPLRVAPFAPEPPDGPASAGPSGKPSIVRELDEDPFGAVAASKDNHWGFSFCALFAYSFLPFFPAGGAGTPLYVAEPGIVSGGSPSLARQRGARSPKSGTAECIGSSFSPPPWMAGSRGKS